MTPPPSDFLPERDLFVKILDDYTNTNKEVKKELRSLSGHVASLDTRVAVVESTMTSNRYEDMAHSMDALTAQLKNPRNTSSSIPRPAGIHWVAKVDWVKFFKGLALFVIAIISFFLGANMSGMFPQ